jgi:hypothetical protein
LPVAAGSIMQTHDRAFSQADICAAYVKIAAIQVETLRLLMAVSDAHGECLRAQLFAAESVLLHRQARFAMCSFQSCPHICGLYRELPPRPAWAELPASPDEQRPAA